MSIARHITSQPQHWMLRLGIKFMTLEE